jgi:hypothetical protein
MNKISCPYDSNLRTEGAYVIAACLEEILVKFKLPQNRGYLDPKSCFQQILSCNYDLIT